MEQTRDAILALFKARDNFQHIGLDDDYFDQGVSSLTVIGLQIDIEKKLGVNIETRELMGFATINQWIDAYTKRVSEDCMKPQQA
ncbi:MAG TPA: acyl carrier protein [Nitrosospira sp.]|jgi:acyl carrier protein|nr:acyl carrier protein [Nitrosospira sp.]